MKEIPLTQGKVALVDDADFEAVSKFKWCAFKTRRAYYAARNSPRVKEGGRPLILMHAFLMPSVCKVDHRDGNGLNNQRENLRSATTRQNNQGFKRKKIGATSDYRGVSWNRRSCLWVSQIKVLGHTIPLGYFPVEADAARAYDIAAKNYFGEFASPNFK